MALEIKKLKETQQLTGLGKLYDPYINYFNYHLDVVSEFDITIANEGLLYNPSLVSYLQQLRAKLKTNTNNTFSCNDLLKLEIKDNEQSNGQNIVAVLPAYNEEVSIGSAVLNIKKYTDRVIVIDGGSTDRTHEIAEMAGAKVIRHSGNSGKDAAIITGIKAADGADIIVIIDPDEQYDSKKISGILDPLQNEDYDVAVSTWSNTNFSTKKKNIMLLNNKKSSNNQFAGLLALSTKSLPKINLTQINGSLIKNLLSQAYKQNLKIKYINFQDEINSNLFDNNNIGVVVPAYNEELLIEETINGIPYYISRIYIIDDCSTDHTPEIIKSMTDPRIVSIRHDHNMGVGAAIIRGYKLALEDEIDIVVVMAGDNQMDPEQLPRLLIPIINGEADYTKGNRIINKKFRSGMTKWRFLGNSMLTMITKIGSGYWHIMDPQNGYTAISRQALEVINLDSIYSYYGYCNDLLIKLNAFGMRAVDIVMPARYGRERSSIKYSRYILKVAPMIFKNFLWRLKIKYVVLDFHPLVLFYIASMLLVPIGVLFSLWIFINKWYQNPVSQNYPLLAVFITLMGLQFLLFAMLFDMQAEKSGRQSI